MSVAQQGRLDGDLSLTDLCTICHVNPLKYTCPRCGVHTCSLPCVKRHKQWAQCSGVRDPAEYRKRSELATSSSIDKDFNFITNVERVVQRADNVVQGRGIDLAPARHPVQGARSKLELNFAERQINIVRAPKGLSRSRQNKTRWAGQYNCVLWTVEWILEDGQKRMGQVHENRPLGESYLSIFGKRSGQLKRKRPDADDGDTQGLNRSDNGPKAGEKNFRSRSEKREELVVEPSMASHDEQPATTDQSTSPITTEEAARPSQRFPQSTETLPTVAIKPEMKPENPTLASQSTKDPGLSDLTFYLHRPDTESRFKCLIPIQAEQNLQEILNNKSLVEFPTIYIRHEDPAELEEPFILEKEYLSRYGADIPINISAPIASSTAQADQSQDKPEEAEDGEVSDDNSHVMKELDGVSSVKVLEVLAKDLGG